MIFKSYGQITRWIASVWINRSWMLLMLFIQPTMCLTCVVCFRHGGGLSKKGVGGYVINKAYPLTF